VKKSRKIHEKTQPKKFEGFRKQPKSLKFFRFSGGPSGNRTPNLLIKSQLLCLVELTARLSSCLTILGAQKKWCARQDSNLRPADSKSDALSGLSYGRTGFTEMTLRIVPILDSR
jgi:hypothetical protein